MLQANAVKPEETSVLFEASCVAMMTMREVQKSACHVAIPFKYAFFTLQEEQSLCFLEGVQNIRLGQPRITFRSPFRVAGVGRSIITRF